MSSASARSVGATTSRPHPGSAVRSTGARSPAAATSAGVSITGGAITWIGVLHPSASR